MLLDHASPLASRRSPSATARSEMPRRATPLTSSLRSRSFTASTTSSCFGRRTTASSWTTRRGRVTSASLRSRSPPLWLRRGCRLRSRSLQPRLTLATYSTLSTSPADYSTTHYPPVWYTPITRQFLCQSNYGSLRLLKYPDVLSVMRNSTYGYYSYNAYRYLQTTSNRVQTIRAVLLVAELVEATATEADLDAPRWPSPLGSAANVSQEGAL